MHDLESDFHKTLLDNLSEGVYFIDLERRITYWNKGAEEITGYSAAQVVGQFCHDHLLNHITDDGHHLCHNGCPLLATLDDGTHREAEVHLHHAEGHRVPVYIRTSAILGREQRIIGAVEVFSNNQSMFRIRRKVDELEKTALVDAVTHIGNRAFCEMKLNSLLTEFRQHDLEFGLLFLDIDRFKIVNDTYGHEIGDRVLQGVARTIASHVRSTDVCGRWGGEEFIAALVQVNAATLPLVAEKLRAMIENSTAQVDGQTIQVTTSIGATLAHQNDTLQSLVKRADELMYQSKQAGRNRVTTD